MESAIPPGAVAASVLVLIWSVVWLASSILLVYMLNSNGERASYITLISIVVSVSSVASIIQQVYYACAWRTIKETAWEQANASAELPSIAFGPLSTGLNLALFEIQYICYSINALLVLGWAVVLAKGVYNLRLQRFTRWEQTISTAYKVVAFVLPPVLIGISFAVRRDLDANLALNMVPIMGSFAVGGILIIATSIHYIRTRRRFASVQGSGSLHTAPSVSTSRSGQPRSAKIQINKVLLLRFSIAFFVLAAFEVTIVGFAFTRTRSTSYLANQAQPDYSTSTATIDIALFIPGVTQSLVAFLLFGTTAHFLKRYKDFFQSATCFRRRRPSLSRTASGMDAWETLDPSGPTSTYECTAASVALSPPSKSGRANTSISVLHEDRDRGGNASRAGDGEVAQPWRVLGLPDR
ncbi:hypothetical protein LTR02_000330 [Friedmanniomyces endolithicus]|nr:hypothetical protein LTR02_000330 [Friedmanniomyces endolithicus]